MERIEIKSRLYDYSVEFTDDFSAVLREFADTTVYIIDKNVYELYKDRFADIDLKKIYFMDAVEYKKNMDTVMAIISFMQKLGVRKNWKAVCFGGGITQDVTTVASNLFLRNIDWYFFPTTLLSMSDSCIGGKCGINLGEYKNQIGVFYPPKKIFIDPCFIKTLSHMDYLNGWGEIIKFSLTRDRAFFEQLKREKQYFPCDNIGEYIRKGLIVKKEIIEEDEFESDLRRVLNYGHTFGHALEAYSGNEIPHGKGVIWGMDVVNYMAWRENLIDKAYYLDIKRLIKDYFITEEIVIQEPDRLFDIIKTDKKVRGNVLHFAMLDGASHLMIHPMEISQNLNRMFRDYLEETHAYYCD